MERRRARQREGDRAVRRRAQARRDDASCAPPTACSSSGDFDFHAARELVPYLRDLGISHLYLSPSLQARSGSTHGYDVVDPTRVSDALGGEEALRALAGEGLGVILDIVPNHMGTGDENRWWADPMRRGLRHRSGERLVPPVLRHRRPRRASASSDQEVFDLLHGKVLELVRDGVIDGVRVDHPDGLADPAGYLRRLRDAGVPHVWVEKILARRRGRCATGRSTGPSATSSSSTSARCSSIRRARRR